MRSVKFGIIAEDDSDVECIKEFIKKINPNKQFKFYKFTGDGCGKIKRKVNSWVNDFRVKGCSSYVIVHDLDRNNIDELKNKIDQALRPSPIKKFLVSIPIEELEAWLLSDPDAFYQVFNVDRKINLPRRPEIVPSPKEYIGRIVRSASKNKLYYLNTRHNIKIAQKIDVHSIFLKCPSFGPFKQFIENI